MYILGTAFGPSAFVLVPTPPDQLEFAGWIDTDSTAFTYTVSCIIGGTMEASRSLCPAPNL